VFLESGLGWCTHSTIDSGGDVTYYMRHTPPAAAAGEEGDSEANAMMITHPGDAWPYDRFKEGMSYGVST
jgi:hypothetical protein